MVAGVEAGRGRADTQVCPYEASVCGGRRSGVGHGRDESRPYEIRANRITVLPLTRPAPPQAGEGAGGRGRPRAATPVEGYRLNSTPSFHCGSPSIEAHSAAVRRMTRACCTAPP